MTPVFTPTDPETWCELLTIEQIAAIVQRPVGGIRKALQAGRFLPAPLEGKPYRWRKVDLLRYTRDARGVLRKAG